MRDPVHAPAGQLEAESPIEETRHRRAPLPRRFTINTLLLPSWRGRDAIADGCRGRGRAALRPALRERHSVVDLQLRPACRLTDNLRAGEVLPARDVVRYDGDCSDHEVNKMTDEVASTAREDGRRYPALVGMSTRSVIQDTAHELREILGMYPLS